MYSSSIGRPTNRRPSIPYSSVCCCVIIIFLVLFLYYNFSSHDDTEGLATSLPEWPPTTADLIYRRRLINAEHPLVGYCKIGPNKCVHIVLASTVQYLTALLASINSIQKNTQRNVFFHLIIAPNETEKFYPSLSELSRFPLEIIEFRDDRVRPLIRIWKGTDRHKNTLNFARYYLPYILPTLSVIIYLDPDTVVHSEIGELRDLYDHRSNLEVFFMASVSRSRNTPVSRYEFLLNCKDEEVSSVVTDPETQYFNAGVYVTDLSLWREHNVTQHLEYWMFQNTKRELWRWGSQAPLAIVFYGNWEDIGLEWNERTMIYVKDEAERQLKDRTTKLYHFAGAVKPWSWYGGEGARLWWLWCRYYPRLQATEVSDRENVWFCRENGQLALLPSSSWDYHFVHKAFARVRENTNAA